jgi:hypothetical protein
MDKPIFTPHCATGIFPAWIPVSEALPNNERCVVVTDGDERMIGLYVEGDEDVGGWWEDARLEECFGPVITHWMELPPPPEPDN